jgi:pyruvate,water dikinase
MSPEEIGRLRHEVENYDAEKKVIKEKQAKILSSLTAEAKEHSWFIQQASLTRLLLKGCWGGTSYFLLPLFSYLAEKAGVSVRDMILFATAKEMADLIEKGTWISSGELERRKQGYFLYFKDGEVSLFAGEEAKAMKTQILDPLLPKETREFKGTIANKGNVQGKVKIIKVDSLKDIQKIAPDLTKEHILVTGMTNPTMMVLVRKVAGIVTDEGGMACHAAIISREFGLPCLVGCHIATQVLRDGDTIELDADHGYVRVLERAT